MITLENVTKKYKNGTIALDDVSLTINDGEFVYIIGETGSGKSTVIKLLDGEEVPTKGKVMVNGINVGRLRFSKVPKYRRTIGVVFQDYQLLKTKTVYDNIAFALEAINKPQKEINKRVRDVLNVIDLANEFKNYPTQLSGGQQQRVVIGRAIANNPKVLIADEPTGNLDPRHSKEIIELLEKINKAGTTIIVVTHDNVLVDQYRKRTIALSDGKIVSDRQEGGYYRV